jgi:sulfate permease, SulP family
MKPSPTPPAAGAAPLRPGVALREAWRERTPGWLRHDLSAGVVVGVVALPLSMALAIASGAPPESGLYTAIVAGALVALLGGARLQVTGPTAAFVVILAPIGARFGAGGLALATVLAGLILIGAALLRLGRTIQFMPYPVTMGFTAGIAIVIATLQVQGLLDLHLAPLAPEAGFVQRAAAIARALPTASWSDALVGGVTLATLGLWPRTRSRIPSPLIGLVAGAAVALVIERLVPDAGVATLASRFGTPEHPAGIPRLPPHPMVPWSAAGGILPDLATVRALAPSAVAIAVLAAIESLLSAVIADGATGTQHDPDAELLALGLGNVVAPFFGGVAATGALARTATNIRSGARTPLAAVFHAAFVLAAVLALAPALGHVPMASLAALLLVVAWNMSEARHVVRVLREAPRSDSLILCVCLTLTVVFDMTVAVSVGVVLAAVLFMRRMVEITEARLISAGHPEEHHDLPPGVQIYEIAGPLFFGAAHKATSLLRRMAPDTKVLILDLSQVPTIDASGLFNLRSALDRLASRGVKVLIAGLRTRTRETLARARMLQGEGAIAAFASVPEAVAAARAMAGGADAGLAAPAVGQRSA